MKINFFQIHGFEAHIKIARILMKTGRFEWSNDLKYDHVKTYNLGVNGLNRELGISVLI